MDGNPTSANPFEYWNFVWFTYCDGSRSLKEMTNPTLYNGTSLFFLGSAIMDGNLEVMTTFLLSATEVIIGGTSAGGLVYGRQGI